MKKLLEILINAVLGGFCLVMFIGCIFLSVYCLHLALLWAGAPAQLSFIVAWVFMAGAMLNVVRNLQK